MYDSIGCMQEFTEVLKNEPLKAYDFISNNSYRMSKNDLANIVKELLYGMRIGCYHPQFEQILKYVQIELDEQYEEEYAEYNSYMNN